MTPEERTRLSAYAEDLGLADLIEEAGNLDAESRFMRERAEVLMLVLRQRMTDEGVELALGAHWKAKIEKEAEYQWPDGAITEAWNLMHKAGEDPVKYIRNTTVVTLRNIEDWYRVMAALEDANLDPDALFEHRMFRSVKNSAHLEKWLKKLGRQTEALLPQKVETPKRIVFEPHDGLPFD